MRRPLRHRRGGGTERTQSPRSGNSHQRADREASFVLFGARLHSPGRFRVPHVDLEAWEAFESHLCLVADKKLEKDPPEEFTVALFFTPYAKRRIGKEGGKYGLESSWMGCRRGVCWMVMQAVMSFPIPFNSRMEHLPRQAGGAFSKSKRSEVGNV